MANSSNLEALPGSAKFDADVPSAAKGGGSRRGGEPPASLAIFERAAASSNWRRRLERLLAHGSQAALVAGLFGFAWAAGSYFSGERSLFPVTWPSAVQTVAPREDTGRAEMLRMAQKTAGDIQALKANIEALRAAQSQSAKESAGLEGLKPRLEAVSAETGAAIAGLASKVERLQREPEAKLSQIIERLDRIEHQTSAPPAGGPPQGKAAAAQGKQRLAEGKPPLEPTAGPSRPPLIRNWVVRGVYDGVALVESPRGAIEVVPGEIIPGAGRVESIQRRGAGWIVVTSQGVVDSARGGYLP